MEYFDGAKKRITYMRLIIDEIEREVEKAEKANISHPHFSWYGHASKGAVRERLVELRRSALKLKKGL